MSRFGVWLMTANGRSWIYRVAAGAIVLLAAYGVLSADKVPLWIGAITALLGLAGPATALGHVTPDPQPEAVEGDGVDG